MGLKSGVDAIICIEGVKGRMLDGGENDFVISGELALTGGGVDEVVGGCSRWRDEGILCVVAGGSDCLSLDFSIVAEGSGDSKG